MNFFLKLVALFWVVSCSKRPNEKKALSPSDEVTPKKRKTAPSIPVVPMRTSLNSMPEEVLLNILQSCDYVVYGELKACTKSISSELLGFHVQYNTAERFLDAQAGSQMNVGLDLAFKDSLNFVLERFPKITAIRMVVSRLTNFGPTSKNIITTCVPFLEGLDEDEKEYFCGRFLSHRPLNNLSEFTELVPLIIGGPDHLIGRIILSRISLDTEETIVQYAEWDKLFKDWRDVVRVIRSAGSKLMMAMYLGMRGLMTIDGINSPDFAARNLGYFRSFTALRIFLGRVPLGVEMENLVDTVMPSGPGADLTPLAQLMTSFCWVSGRGMLQGLEYLRYLFPGNVAECPDLCVPLQILADHKHFEVSTLSKLQLKFLRLFDHSGRDVDQLAIDSNSVQCIQDSTTPETIRFICTELYRSSAGHMSALYNTIHSALDFTAPTRLGMFRSRNHLLAWSCLVSWVHREQHLVVDVVMEIVKEMYDAVEGGVNCDFVEKYRKVLYEIVEFRVAITEALFLVPKETRQVLAQTYFLS